MNSILYAGESDECTVSEVVHQPGYIFELIKMKQLAFDDEVLKEAHISKTIRDVRII